MKLISQILIVVSFIMLSNVMFADNTATSANSNQPVVNQTNIYIYQPMPIVNPNQGWYLGADFGAGSAKCNNCTFTFDNDSDILAESSSTHSGGIFDIIAGYQINKYVAIETGFGTLPGVDLVGTLQSGSTSHTASTSSSSVHSYFAVKAMYPLPNQFGLVGRLGYDMLSLNFSSNSSYYTYSTQPSGTLLSLGGSYNFNAHWSAILAYNQIMASDSSSKYNFNYGTLGISYLAF
jgi:hypothetical protein